MVLEQDNKGPRSNGKQGRGKGEADITSVDNVASLKENVSRTTQFLKELRTLSSTCQEHPTKNDDRDEEMTKERQLFIRRIVQVGTEIQDARDNLTSICKQYLPVRQWRLLFDDDGEIRGNDFESFGRLTGFDLDPSVQFFGMDWDRIFGRCFNLNLNVQVLERTLANGGGSEVELDLVLISRMLKDFAAVEADVTSHAEAVLRGRLSKSQQKLIFREQMKYEHQTRHNLLPKRKVTISKSRSFREPRPAAAIPEVKSNISSGPSGKPLRYKKTKTTNLDRLTASFSAHSLKSATKPVTSNEDEDVIEVVQCSQEPIQTTVTMKTSASMESTPGAATTATSSTTATTSTSSSTSFLQNVSFLFKNIR